MELMKARNIAVDICYKLQPFCDRLNIAGSIRRKKDFVKDIEIVAQPKEVQSLDLFSNAASTMRSEGFIKEVLQIGSVIKGKPSGRMMQIELKEGINLDLFIPQPTDYFRQYAIRTGSAAYASLVIATGWKKLGWCGTEDGLRKIGECEEKKLPDNKSKWVCKKENPTLPPVFENEEDFFKWLEVPFLNPINRSM